MSYVNMFGEYVVCLILMFGEYVVCLILICLVSMWCVLLSLMFHDGKCVTCIHSLISA